MRQPVAERAAARLGEHVAELDACVAGKTGSLTAMLAVAPDGTLGVRAGGLGDKRAEDCVATAIGKLHVDGASQPVELECVLAVRGGGPLRVTVESAAARVEVSRSDVRTPAGTYAFDALPEEAAWDDTVLVIVDPDVPSVELSRVLAWTARAPAVLVAVRADGGAPVFVALAPDRGTGTVREPRLGVVVANKTLHACAADHRGNASLLDARRVDATVAAALAACATCDDAVEVGVGREHVAKDLVGAASAVRRAGRDPVIALSPRCKP